MGLMKEAYMDMFDAPGMITHRGSIVSIDSDGTFYVQHGSRTTRVEMDPLHWQLVCVALTKLQNSGTHRIVIEGRRGTVTLARHPRGIEVRAEGYRALTILLNKNETDALYRSARHRAPTTHQQGE